ncbi:hypothetical protein DY000_02003229 [Brassica cretica]|uniref:Non-haem dioxygenase N-terminal domain-containing protein n=1 Tax=Brassica cretica TaxID=69181 RepID=A0ABQ7BVX5_BRACR|nr:hypothetical protein DY000_02003229 [Brassica cretica]
MFFLFLILFNPVIDFSYQTLKPGTSKWDKVKADVRKALEDYGCFEAFFDKVSLELDKERGHGWPISHGQSRRYKWYQSQSFGIDDTNLAEKVKDFTQKLWPDHGIKRVRFEIRF